MKEREKVHACGDEYEQEDIRYNLVIEQESSKEGKRHASCK